MHPSSQAGRASGPTQFLNEKATARQEGERLPPEQVRVFWKYKVGESVSIALLFPSLSASAFNAVMFKESAIDSRAKKIHAEPAGLYIRASIAINGASDEIFTIFKHYLGDEAKPMLRMSAFLGVSPLPDHIHTTNGLVLSGSLEGRMAPFPPAVQLLAHVSMGITLRLGGQASHLLPTGVPPESGGVHWEFYGELFLELPGVIGPTRLEFRAFFDEVTEIM
ncbi:hypothetical protein F5Y16DRAFT_308950 [Xylariaceae sp. FL0255]|nr:hypothetical protein F5Y16DRAFT_308950 [Xylariaceae sp. FL0255]